MKTILLSFLLFLPMALQAAPVSGTVTLERRADSGFSDALWMEFVDASQLTGGALQTTGVPMLVTSRLVATWTYASTESNFETTADVISFLETLKFGQDILGVSVTWENISVEGSTTPVVFPDAALEEAILQALDKDTGPVTEGELRNLGKLSLRGTNVRDLTGLEKAGTLEVLDLTGSQVPDNDTNLEVIRSLEIYCFYVNGALRWVTVITGDLSTELVGLNGERILGYFETASLPVFSAGLLPLDLGNETNQNFFRQLEDLGVEVETNVEFFFIRAIFSGLQGLDALPTADPDRDGVPNLIAHAFGFPLNISLDPQSLDKLPAPLISEAGNQAGVCFILPEDLPDDVIYTVEYRAGLGEEGWTEIARNTGDGVWNGSAMVTETMNPDGTQTIKVFNSQQIQNSSNGFLRLRALLKEE